jgi:hypothetical protein
LNQTGRPERYWHCYVEMAGAKGRSIVNDMTLAELERTVVSPWLEGRPFTVSGTIVRSADTVTKIKIVHTTDPASALGPTQRRNESKRNRGHGDRSQVPTVFRR